ncbi:hypothetical protein HYH02_006494 [Chlamydomonas schloesseri]|uniref:Mechanosensitive ion channel MscS domain-containing protein n=1 Tax=Chlamydomonas schloesseri TaxID=2026947 RepID=A0A835WJ29_9CHLO|nr:hypothetical protein HYH02_006494 [Chlamydomonas schloesseri]|eukprot:KAG2448604.1 hypothetical protein HYH02_006494 [Chlamydomonas schloesseri]
MWPWLPHAAESSAVTVVAAAAAAPVLTVAVAAAAMSVPPPHPPPPPYVPPDPALVATLHPGTAALRQAGLEVAAHVLLPLLALWALQRWLAGLEARTKQEVQEGVAAARRSGAAGGAPSLARELADALPIAATAPSRVVLAALTATHVARSLANTAQGLAERALLDGWLGGPDSQAWVLGCRVADLVEGASGSLARLDQVLVVVYQMLLVAFVTWVLLSWKDVALSRFLLRAHDTAAGRQDLERILTPLNTVATWALVVCAGVVVVSLVGVDVRPLLVLTGGGGVVAGLASQQLLSNAVSGLQMYMDRPFRVGDTIAVTAGVNTYLGEVVEVAALRTHLALEDGSTVALPNRSLSDMVITNKSRTSRGLNRPPWLDSRTPLSLQLRVRLRPATYADLGAELAGLQTAILASDAVEAEGAVAPRLEVAGYSDRGVEVLARVRLRNPSKLAAAAASGSLAPPPFLPMPQQATVAATSLGLHEAGPVVSGGGSGAGSSGGGSRAGRSRCSVEAVRALRQQLLLALGPWLQDHNATLAIE